MSAQLQNWSAQLRTLLHTLPASLANFPLVHTLPMRRHIIPIGVTDFQFADTDWYRAAVWLKAYAIWTRDVVQEFASSSPLLATHSNRRRAPGTDFCNREQTLFVSRLIVAANHSEFLTRIIQTAVNADASTRLMWCRSHPRCSVTSHDRSLRSMR